MENQKDDSKRENEESVLFRRLRAVEKKIDLLERGLDVNINESNAVLLFVQLNRTDGRVVPMLTDRFDKEELREAATTIGVRIKQQWSERKIADMIVAIVQQDKFKHKRSDRGQRHRQGLAER